MSTSKWNLKNFRLLPLAQLKESFLRPGDELDLYEHALAKSDMFVCALCYKEGWGVKKDPKRALGLFCILYIEGDDDARMQISICYHMGIGCVKNPRKAFELIWGSENGNNAGLLARLGNYYGGVFEDSELQHLIDLPRAVALYERSAALGNSVGLYNLGVMLYAGRGCVRNQVRGLEMIIRSAKTGFATAAQKLGELVDQAAVILGVNVTDTVVIEGEETREEGTTDVPTAAVIIEADAEIKKDENP